MQISVKEIKNIVKGTYITASPFLDDKKTITGICTDSRSVKQGDLFIPLKGEQHDGHKYIQSALSDGAVTALTEKIETNITDGFVILVKSTSQALLDLAEHYNSRHNIPSIAVTGSVGKTTTKDIISAVLSERYSVHKTQGNFNNEIGLPATVFGLKPSHQVAVFEMGMNHFGEIRRLSKVVKPRVAVITNIGVAHIGNLGSREGILEAKSEIFEHMGSDSIALLNSDDYMLQTLPSRLKNKIVWYGLNPNNDYYATDITSFGLNGSTFTVVTPKGELQLFIKEPGRHMVLNAVAATAIGQIFGLTGQEIKSGLESYTATRGRMEIKRTGTVTIIDGSYNASPEAMKVSIDVLQECSGRRVAIVGDMLELGEESSAQHKKVGRLLAINQIEKIICIGEKACLIYEEALQNNIISEITYYSTKEQLMSEINNNINSGDTILVKASHCMGFEKIVETLLEV